MYKNARIGVVIPALDEEQAIARVIADIPEWVDEIVVADNGPGISAAAKASLFRPFISAKPNGMGIGLAVSRAIAEAHGGTLDDESRSHGQFRLVLPVEHTHA